MLRLWPGRASGEHLLCVTKLIDAHTGLIDSSTLSSVRSDFPVLVVRLLPGPVQVQQQQVGFLWSALLGVSTCSVVVSSTRTGARLDPCLQVVGCAGSKENALETSQRTQHDFVFSRFDASAGGTGMVPKWSLRLNLRRFLYHLSNTAEREIRERERVCWVMV